MPIATSQPATERAMLLARFFQILADPTRVRIVELLLEREHTVGELVELLGVQQGRVSSHLACLKWCGIVSARREGKYIHYRISDRRVTEVMQRAQSLLADHAGAVASCLRLDGAAC